ncbi:MAG: hypothetical protein EA370_13520 [Wenzhouxiangella sp.]|nr:MAG: hypothetical protein EA370_13520 [Wenzhouxiangella sp.]
MMTHSNDQVTRDQVSSDQVTTFAIDNQALDGGGGIGLSGLSGNVRIASRHLRALDLADSPDLIGLDLSGCRDDLRVRLVKPRKLRWILLPEGPVGTTVELELPDRFEPIKPLAIKGPVAEFGLCAAWLVLPWRVGNELGHRPLDGLFVGPPNARPGSHRAAAHVLVGRALKQEQLELDCRGIERLVIMGSQVERLHLENASLALLDVSECRRLQEITGRFQARKASLSVCRKLQRIGGSGRHLELACLHAPSLALDGRWLKTSMLDCETERLAIRRRTHLDLERLPRLHTITADEPYEMKPGRGILEADQLITRFGHEPGSLHEYVMQQLPRVGPRDQEATHWLENIALKRNGRELPEALQALGDLARNPADRKAAWLVRCALASLYLHGQDALTRVAHRGCSRWDWPKGPRGQPINWFHDLVLYYRCRELPLTRPFTRLLSTANRIGPASALAQASSGEVLPANEARHCLQLLDGCLRRLDLQHPDDEVAVLGPAARESAQPCCDMPNYLVQLNLRGQHLLPGLVERLVSIGDEGLVSRLAHAMIEHLPRHGLLLAECGIQLARVSQPAGRRMIASALASGTHLPDDLRARGLQILFRHQAAS